MMTSNLHPKTPVANVPDRDQFYRLLARNLPNTALFLLDNHLRILVAEGQALQSAGYKSSAVEGMLITDVLSAGNDALIEQYKEALSGVDSVRQYDLVEGFYTVHAISVRDEQGTVAYLMVVANNITRQIESDRRTRAMLDALPDAMFVINREGRILDMHFPDENSALYPYDFSGLLIEDIPAPHNILKMTRAAMQNAFDTGEMQTFEYDFHFENVHYYFEGRTIKVNKDETLTLIRDISLRKRIAQSLTERNNDLEILRGFDQELNQKLSISHVVENALGYVVRLSEANCGFIALLDTTLLTPSLWTTNCNESVVRRLCGIGNPLLYEVLTSKAPRYIEIVADLPDYQRILPSTVAAVLLPLVANDNTQGIIVLEVDLETGFSARHLEALESMIHRIAIGLENAHLYAQSERHLIELQTLYAKVRNLEQIKTDMIRLASHDLKNPLAGMMGYVEMLRWEMSNTLSADQQRYMKDIQDAIERMQRIINGILSLERIEEIARDEINELVDIGQLIQRVLYENQAVAHRKSQLITLEMPPKAIRVIGDVYQLHEAMSNLISNAIKYTPEKGSVRVTLEVESERMRFQVFDTGYGIPQHLQGKLFEPFYRARTQETTHMDGSGLGLSLVKNIIERHQGTIIFSSEYRKGSTFGFTLPLAAAP